MGKRDGQLGNLARPQCRFTKSMRIIGPDGKTRSLQRVLFPRSRYGRGWDDHSPAKADKTREAIEEAQRRWLVCGQASAQDWREAYDRQCLVGAGQGGAGLGTSGRRLGSSRTMSYDVWVEGDLRSPSTDCPMMRRPSKKPRLPCFATLHVRVEASLDQRVPEWLTRVDMNNEAALGKVGGVSPRRPTFLFIPPRKGVQGDSK